MLINDYLRDSNITKYQSIKWGSVCFYNRALMKADSIVGRWICKPLYSTGKFANWEDIYFERAGYFDHYFDFREKGGDCYWEIGHYILEDDIVHVYIESIKQNDESKEWDNKPTEILSIPTEQFYKYSIQDSYLTLDLVKEIEKLSYQKAFHVFKEHKDAIVIGSDTIVKINNEILGKPKNYDEAKKMLQTLSNNTHEVVTGVTILKGDKVETFSSVAKVSFYPLTDEEIDEYIKTNEPMDKAGAYAIQGIGAKFIKTIDGDFYTIMGLPVAELYHRIQKYL